MNILSLVLYSVTGAFFIVFLALMFVLVTAGPVLWPYLSVKLKGGTLLILHTLSGSYRFVATDRDMHTKRHGDYLPYKPAVMYIGGVPCALAYEGFAVPVDKDVSDAGKKLDDANIEPLIDPLLTAEKAVQQGILAQRDLVAISKYMYACNPHYVNSRIERRAAELLRQSRDNFSKVAAYSAIFIMIIMAAALAYYIVSTGASSGVSDAVSNAASSITV